MGATAPLGITITLAVLTVVGTITGAWGGQWIAARRDDKRWEREIAREDIRWHREQQRERHHREHEREDVRRQEAIRAVARYVGCLRVWHTVIWDIYPVSSSGQSLTEHMSKRLRHVEQDAADALGLLELVSSGEVQEVARDAWFEHSRADEYLTRMPEARLLDELTRLNEELDWVLIIAKRELGFDEYRPSGWRPPNDEAPTGTTSPPTTSEMKPDHPVRGPKTE